MSKRYQHLVMQERALIEAQLGLGVKPSAIALGSGRSRSTVTREMHPQRMEARSAAASPITPS
jgi:IS30 family transposase